MGISSHVFISDMYYSTQYLVEKLKIKNKFQNDTLNALQSAKIIRNGKKSAIFNYKVPPDFQKLDISE